MKPAALEAIERGLCFWTNVFGVEGALMLHAVSSPTVSRPTPCAAPGNIEAHETRVRAVLEAAPKLVEDFVVTYRKHMNCSDSSSCTKFLCFIHASDLWWQWKWLIVESENATGIMRPVYESLGLTPKYSRGSVTRLVKDYLGYCLFDLNRHLNANDPGCERLNE